MGLSITISVSGETAFERELGVRIDALKDLRPAWDEVESFMEKLEKSIFMNQGAGSIGTGFSYVSYGSWKPLKESTIRAKRKAGYGTYADFPLIRTQKMMKAWTDSKSDGAIRVKLPLFFAYGIDENEIPYAKYHQLGGSKIPQRKMLLLTDTLKSAIVKIIQSFIVKSGQFVRQNRTVFNG